MNTNSQKSKAAGPSVKLELTFTPPSSKRKLRIVFTNGCFDLLHPGHIYLLKKARKLGDKLIVGLDSDESVKSLNKSPRRPIQNQEARAEVLRSIRWVDEVRLFNSGGLLSLLKEIKPDIMVKGGDWTEDTVVGGTFVKSYGGKVVILPYLEGLSTTKLIHQIRTL